MAVEPFLGEITPVSFNFPPKGHALCWGQLLPINQNQALFSLLGTTYGGDGATTFALPDLRGRVPLHTSPSFLRGQRGGAESVALTQQEIPAHTHAPAASGAEATSTRPAGRVQARGGMYDTLRDVGTGAVDSAGGGQAHQNMPPFLVMPFCVALQGIFPSQN